MKKRILAMALTAAMMLSLFPASAFALPESQPTASSSEIVAQLNESASGDSQPAASEKTNSEPTAASEKAASSEAVGSEAVSSEATSSEAASSEASSSEAVSSEATSSEPAQAEGDISVASENGERKINFWPFFPPKPTCQWVYVYTKVTGNTAGLVLNSDGYYTLGRVKVEGMPSPKKDLTGQDYQNALNKVKAALGGIERYKDNRSIALKDVVFDEKSLIREPNGAADYVEKGYTWHLDGKLDVKFYGTVTFKHVDQDGNEFTQQTSDGTLYPAGTTLQFGKGNAIPDAAEKFGYEYVGVDPESYTVQGQTNKEITVKYKKVMTDVSYTVEYYKDNAQAETETVSSKVWVKDAQKIAIDASAAPSADRYEGYQLDKVEPAYPTAGTMVPNGTVYKAYYKKVLTQLNTLIIDAPKPATYDGQEHKWVPIVTDGNGKTLTAGTDYDVVYESETPIQEKEKFKEFFDVSNIKVTITGKGNYTGEVKYNYSITPRSLTVTAASETRVYNGESWNNETYTTEGLVKGENPKIWVQAQSADYHVTDVTPEKGVENHVFLQPQGNFKKENYNVDLQYGVLIVIPRPVTLTSASDSKTYDGKPLTNATVTDEYTDKDGNKLPGFVAGEGAAYDVTGKQTDAGSSKNTFTYTLNEGTKAENYAITKVEGDLLVNPVTDKVTVSIEGRNATAEYDGKEHQVTDYDIVQDGISNKLYQATDFTIDQRAEAKGTDAGTYGMGLTANRFTNNNKNFTNVEFLVKDGTLTINRRTLTITTKSATKTYDGSDLTEANGYSIDGLVNGETVNFSITGRQKEVGSSDNTYVIDWSQSTAKQGNYKIENNLGKLTVTSSGSSSGGSSSGGGSSSTPTPAPEQAPTPTPVPVIVPAAPTPAPTRVRRVAPAATATPAPTAKPTETIAESEPPKAESEPEVIEDEETPLAPMATGKWALVNLVLMILTVLASLLMLLGVIGKKRGRNNKSFWRIASLIPAIGALAAFVLTENMKLPMAMVDRWTLLMVIIAVLQLIVAAMSKKQNESEDDGANA